MANTIKDYSPEDQKRMKDWMKQQGGAADIGMAISALGAKPVTTNNSLSNIPTSTLGKKPASGNLNSNQDPLVTQVGTKQYVTPFTERQQQGLDTWYDMLTGKNGGSYLPGGVEKSIKRMYDRAGENAYNSSIGNMTEFTGGRLNSWAAKAASDSKQDYALQGSNAINNANLQYAQMFLNGIRDYTGTVSGLDDVAYGRDFTERQQDFTDKLAIGETTGYLPMDILPNNNPWIVNGKAVEGIDFQAKINELKALNPNHPDIPLLNQARNLKIQSDPELMKKYGSTMSANIGYETLTGKKIASDIKAQEAITEYNNALLEWQKDPNNPENIARLKNAQANLASAGASVTNAATNAAKLTWDKDPANPSNILKLSQAEGNSRVDKYTAITNDLAQLTPQEAYDELKTYKKEYIADLTVEVYNKLVAAYKKALGEEEDEW